MCIPEAPMAGGRERQKAMKVSVRNQKSLSPGIIEKHTTGHKKPRGDRRGKTKKSEST